MEEPEDEDYDEDEEDEDEEDEDEDEDGEEEFLHLKPMTRRKRRALRAHMFNESLALKKRMRKQSKNRGL